MELPSYLAVSRHGIFYFRVRVPADLRVWFPHSETIRRSTKTADKRQAIERARQLAAHAANVFRGMRMHRDVAPSGAMFELLYKADLTALGLGVHEIRYDPANEAHREEANRHITYLRNLTPSRSEPHARPSTAMLSAVVAEFMQEIRKSKATATVDKYEHTLQCFLELSGDMPITAVSQTTLGGFKRQIARLPRHASKLPETREKSIKELVAEEHAECIADRTLNTHLRNVVSFMRWARGHYSGVQTLTSDKLAISIKTRADEDRDIFSDDALGRIFGLSFGELPAHKRWLLLIGLFSGARIEELCQLNLRTDVYEEAGVGVFDFNDLADDKALKTKASKRKVPIHPALLQLGILSYFDQVKARGCDRPFPEWEPYRGRWSKNASKWAGRYFDACGVTDKRMCFHSFRHGALNAMKQAGIDEGKAAAVAGQTYGGITFSRYGKRFPPNALLDAVRAINFPAVNAALGLSAEVVPLKAAA